MLSTVLVFFLMNSTQLSDDLSEIVKDLDLRDTISKIADGVEKVSLLLRTGIGLSGAGSINASGDNQLHIDLAANRSIFDSLEGGSVYAAASEETPDFVKIGHGNFLVVFDPIDGSSVVDCNFSVGAIFGIFEKHDDSFIGIKGSDQVAALMAVFGPRTVLLIGVQNILFEIILTESGWTVSRKPGSMSIATEASIFAPGNLKASNDIKGYKALIDTWMTERKTLRYTGALVPDIYQIFAKSQGIFSCPFSEKSPAKLRLIFECAPIAFLIELAGGSAFAIVNGKAIRVLDIIFEDMDQRCSFFAGSTDAVNDALENCGVTL